MDVVAVALLSTKTVVFYVCWPVLALARTAHAVLYPLYSLVRFALLPAAYLVSASLSIATAPYRYLPLLLDRIEALYVFFGVAAIVGGIAGAFLFALSDVLVSAFGIQDAADHSYPEGKSDATNTSRVPDC